MSKSWYNKYIYDIDTNFTIYCANSTETEVFKVHKFVVSDIKCFDTKENYVIVTEYDSSTILLFIDYCYLGKGNKHIYDHIDKEQLSLLIKLSLTLGVPDLYNFVAKLRSL